jgi:hypothetical protein
LIVPTPSPFYFTRIFPRSHPTHPPIQLRTPLLSNHCTSFWLLFSPAPHSSFLFLDPIPELEESLRSEISSRQRSEESVKIEKNRNNTERKRNHLDEDEDLEPDSARKEFDSSGAGDGVLFYRKALAFLKLKNLNRDKKHRVFSELKEELAASNEAMSFLEQRLGDYSVMIKVCVALLSLLT